MWCGSWQKEDLDVSSSPIIFVRESRVEQGLTAWAFKGVKPCRHKNTATPSWPSVTSSLMSQYIQLVRLHARGTQMLAPSGSSRKDTTTFWIISTRCLYICSLGKQEKWRPLHLLTSRWRSCKMLTFSFVFLQSFWQKKKKTTYQSDPTTTGK